MAGQTQILKRYENFGGLDLRSGDLLRNPLSASEMENAERIRSGTLTSRKGYYSYSNSGGGIGLFIYNDIDTTTGVSIPIILGASTKLNKVVQTTMLINYDESRDAAVTGYTTIQVRKKVKDDSSEWEFSITADGTEIYSKDLGLGFDEASSVTLADLKTDIDALDDFLVTITGTDTIPAAFLPPIDDELLDSDGNFTTTAEEWEEVNHPSNADDSPFTTAFGNRNDEDFENISSVSLRNVMYFGTGVDELHKYDGVDCYRAGMPQPATAGVAALVGGSGSISDTNINYIYTYLQHDAKGNIIEGIPSAVSNTLSPSSKDIDVTISTIQNTTGFNTDCAIVAGAQTGVNTITVDDGSGGSHTMKVGQTAYFYDGVTSAYVTREITSVAATTITIAGDAVDVTDNLVISNNLRIAIYRNTAGGTLYYLVEEIPNDSFSSTEVYRDDTATVTSNAVFLDPADIAAEHGLPPKGKYLTEYRGLLIVSGNPEAVNTTYYSDIASPEAFPSQFNFDVYSGVSEPVKGVGVGNEFLYVFKEQSAFIVNGDLTSGQFRVDRLEGAIGCAAHATIKDVEGILVFLSSKGVYAISGAEIPIEISQPILPLFTKIEPLDDRQLVLKRATAGYDKRNEKYILYIPAEEDQNSNIVPNENSRLLVYDLFHARAGGTDGQPVQPWYLWTNMNAANGIVVDGENLYFQEKRFSTFDSTVKYILYKRLNTGKVECDAADNLDPIDWEYVPGWETVGEPSVPKQFLRSKVYSMDPNNPAGFTLTLRTERDFKPNEFITTATVNYADSDSGGWGVSAWGVAPWGAPVIPAEVVRLKTGRKISAMRYRLSHSILYQAPFITAIETEISTPYRIDMKSKNE